MVRFTKDPNKKRIFDIEPYFESMVDIGKFTKQHEDIIYAIDKAVVLDYNLGTILTPYGVCGINNLSNGSKTVLLALQIIQDNKMCEDLILDTVSCGYNALLELLKVVDNTDLVLYWGTFIKENICWDFDLDGIKFKDSDSMIQGWMESLYDSE